MRPIRHLTCLTLAALPLPLLADCPDRNDMARGVMVTFDNGDTTTLRALEGTLIEMTEVLTWDPQVFVFEADFGLYALRETEMSPGGALIPESVMTFTYPEPLPPPADDATGWAGTRQVHEFGLGNHTESWQVGFRTTQALTIGACTYDAIAVGIRLRQGEPDQKDQFSYYLPALGAGFIVTWVDEDGQHDTVAVLIQALN